MHVTPLAAAERPDAARIREGIDAFASAQGQLLEARELLMDVTPGSSLGELKFGFVMQVAAGELLDGRDVLAEVGVGRPLPALGDSVIGTHSLAWGAYPQLKHLHSDAHDRAKHEALRAIDAAAAQAADGLKLLREELAREPRTPATPDPVAIRSAAARYTAAAQSLEGLHTLVTGLRPHDDATWKGFEGFSTGMLSATRDIVAARDVLRQALPEHELGELQWLDIEELAGDSVGDAFHLRSSRVDPERFESLRETTVDGIATALENARAGAQALDALLRPVR